jgi:hypothetical protein
VLSNENHTERSFPIPKEAIDTLNSISWFLMDAFWMLQIPSLSQALILPTVASGFVLLYIEKRRSLLLINVAICCWILMNISWMLADTHHAPALLTVARWLFGLGAASVVLAIRYSSDLRETFSHFKRFRLLQAPAGPARARVRKTRIKRQRTPYTRAIQ